MHITSRAYGWMFELLFFFYVYVYIQYVNYFLDPDIERLTSKIPVVTEIVA